MNVAEDRLMRRAYFVAGEFFADGMTRDDLAQEALIGALEARRDHRNDRGTLDAFEWVCMRRQVFDAVRDAHRLKHGPLNDARHLDDYELTGPDVMQPRAELAAILAALPTLTVAEREALRAALNERRADDNALYRARVKLKAAAA